MKQLSKTNFKQTGFLVVLVLALSSCGNGSSTNYGDNSGTSMPPAVSTVQIVACPASGTTDVSIAGITAGFSPASVTVAPDTTIKWTNNDAMTHTVTSTSVPSGGTFDAAVVAGASICMKFTTAGTFNYHCSIHPATMIGVVSVQ